MGGGNRKGGWEEQPGAVGKTVGGGRKEGRAQENNCTEAVGKEGVKRRTLLAKNLSKVILLRQFCGDVAVKQLY